MRSTLLTGLLAGAFLAGPGALAQTLTDDEIAERFLMQKDLQAEGLGQSRGLDAGGNRGLSLITVAPEDSTDTGVTVSGNANTQGQGSTGSVDPNAPLVVAVFPEEIEVDLNIRFGFDSAAIARSEEPKLDQMCRVIKASPEIDRFRVIGHTDASGSEEYNQKLSALRAEEVARYLVNECGIAATRLETLGLGERVLENPADPDAEENRRVEFQAMS